MERILNEPDALSIFLFNRVCVCVCFVPWCPSDLKLPAEFCGPFITHLSTLPCSVSLFNCPVDFFFFSPTVLLCTLEY